MINPLKLKGVIPILTTPFASDESLDLTSLDRLVRFMADLKVDGITILGVLGEANRLTDYEREQVISTAVAAADNRFPVIVGASHQGTHAAAVLSCMAMELGADAVMITPHSEPGLTSDSILNLFEQVATMCKLPIVLQDHPASTGVQMPVDLILQLTREVGQITCIKAESVPTAPKICSLKKGLTRPVTILTGLGALYALFDLTAGSDGFMTGFAFPEILLAMVKANDAGDKARVQALYQKYLPLIVYEQQPKIAIRKSLLHQRGLIDSSTVRRPGSQITEDELSRIDALLSWILPNTDLQKPLFP